MNQTHSQSNGTFAERRESPRILNAEQAIRCWIKSDRIHDKASHCELVDVSHTGFGIESLDKLPVGDDIKLDIEYQGRLLKDADAFVAYCHHEDDHYRIGLVLNFRRDDMLACDTYNFLNDILDGVQS